MNFNCSSEPARLPPTYALMKAWSYAALILILTFSSTVLPCTPSLHLSDRTGLPLTRWGCTLVDNSYSPYAWQRWRVSERCNGVLNSHEPLFTETPRHLGFLFFSRYFTLRSALFTLLQLRHGEWPLLGPVWAEAGYNAQLGAIAIPTRGVNLPWHRVATAC